MQIQCLVERFVWTSTLRHIQANNNYDKTTSVDIIHCQYTEDNMLNV